MAHALSKLMPVALLILLAGCSPPWLAPSPNETPASPSPSAAPNAPPQVPTTDERVFIPGDRFGLVTGSTTRQELATLYGEANLEDMDVSVGEGFTEPGTRVNLGDRASFSIVWMNESRTAPKEVRDIGADWKTPESIGMGTSFSELQNKLGSFELYGFAWDYGGTIMLEDTQLDAYEGLLLLRVHPTQQAIASSEADYKAVLGDRLYPSTDPHFSALNPVVDDVVMYFEKLEDAATNPADDTE
ncbi:hypothetical protein ACQ4M4_17730 [Leptolyngbya sp. AN02str]|uniref:hypothetical protein n=1 Tax=Leptolyngbya sp. AN02str TaxID=3423363 RepID=UPI003D318F17